MEGGGGIVTPSTGGGGGHDDPVLTLLSQVAGQLVKEADSPPRAAMALAGRGDAAAGESDSD